MSLGKMISLWLFVFLTVALALPKHYRHRSPQGSSSVHDVRQIHRHGSILRPNPRHFKLHLPLKHHGGRPLQTAQVLASHGFRPHNTFPAGNGLFALQNLVIVPASLVHSLYDPRIVYKSQNSPRHQVILLTGNNVVSLHQAGTVHAGRTNISQIFAALANNPSSIRAHTKLADVSNSTAVFTSVASESSSAEEQTFVTNTTSLPGSPSPVLQTLHPENSSSAAVFSTVIGASIHTSMEKSSVVITKELARVSSHLPGNSEPTDNNNSTVILAALTDFLGSSTEDSQVLNSSAGVTNITEISSESLTSHAFPTSATEETSLMLNSTAGAANLSTTTTSGPAVLTSLTESNQTSTSDFDSAKVPEVTQSIQPDSFGDVTSRTVREESKDTLLVLDMEGNLIGTAYDVDDSENIGGEVVEAILSVDI